MSKGIANYREAYEDFMPAFEVLPGQLIDSFEEPASLHYFEHPLQVKIDTTEATTTYTVHSDHAALKPDHLIDLLNKAAPSPYPQDRLGISADWGVVDQAKEPGNDLAQELTTLHRHLGEPWLEFMRSRPAFNDVAADGGYASFETSEAHAHTGSVPRGFILAHDSFRLSPKQMLKKAIERHFKEVSSAFDFLASCGIEDPMATLGRSLQQTLGEDCEIDENTWNAKLKKVNRRGDFGNNILSLLSEEDMHLVAEEELQRNQRVYIARDGRQYFYNPKQYDAEAIDEVFEAGPITVLSRQGKHEALAYELPLPPAHLPYSGSKQTVQRLILPDSISNLEGSSTIKPILSWRKANDGSRSFVFPRLVETGRPPTYLDGVLGVLVLIYLSPDITDTWPEEMRIRGSRKVPLGAAQLPVLALFPHMQQQLLNSRLVSGIEARAATF